MFPKFIQVGLYSGGAYIRRAYIRDVNWDAHLAGVSSEGLIYGGRINGILRYVISWNYEFCFF